MSKDRTKIKVEFEIRVRNPQRGRWIAELVGKPGGFTIDGDAKTRAQAIKNLGDSIKRLAENWEPPYVHTVGEARFLIYRSPYSVHMMRAPSGIFGGTSIYDTPETAHRAARKSAAQEAAIIPEDCDPLNGDPRIDLLCGLMEKVDHLGWYCWQCSYRKLRRAGDPNPHANSSSLIPDAVRAKFIPPPATNAAR